MATELVKSLKRLYERGVKGQSPSITLEQVKERVKKGTIDTEQYTYITGLVYEE